MNEQILEMIRAKKGFICDMDGVIYHGNQLLPPAKAFVEWLQRENKQDTKGRRFPDGLFTRKI